MAGVVTVTVNPSLDSTMTADRVEADRKTRCDDVVRHPGGGGLNVARVVHEVGGQATAVWTCGGLFGTGLQDQLEASILTHVPVAIRGETRENVAVIESDSRRHFRFVTPGPDISEEELDRVAQAVRDEDPDLLVLSGSLPPSVDDAYYADLARVGKEQGARVVVDAHGAPLRAALESGHVDLCKPNYRELAELVGVDPDDAREDVEAVARRVVEQGSGVAVVVSLGAAGVALVTRDEAVRIPAPTVPIRSQIGAGDSTVGGIVFRLAQGDSLQSAVRFGVACGSAAVMTEGTELCRRSDVERLTGHAA